MYANYFIIDNDFLSFVPLRDKERVADYAYAIYKECLRKGSRPLSKEDYFTSKKTRYPARCNLFHQNIIDLLIQPPNFFVQLFKRCTDVRAFHSPHSLESEQVGLFRLYLIPQFLRVLLHPGVQFRFWYAVSVEI